MNIHLLNIIMVNIQYHNCEHLSRIVNNKIGLMFDYECQPMAGLQANWALDSWATNIDVQ